MSASGKTPSESKKLKQTTMGNFTSATTTTRSSRHNWNFTDSFFANVSKRDTDQYRKGYPGKKDDPKSNDNLLFYTNKLASYPDGDYIDIIHKKWWGDYSRLEVHHGYIQWIFPIRESGMNWYAQELQLHEAKAIIEDPKAKARVLKSYKMMLDFYGMELEDEETGHIVRAQNYKERFAHLNRSYHNYLRITRMLKSLGELGYEHLKRPFVEFVLEEALETEMLSNCLDSCYKYWLETIKDNKARKNLKKYVDKMEAGYGTKYPPGQDDSDIDEMDEGGNEHKIAEGGHHDDRHGDMYDEDSLEAKYLQEEEDRLIATHEQLNEDLLAKQHRRTWAKKNSNEQENRLSKSIEEKMDTDDATTEQDQTKNVTKTETNSQGKDAPNTEGGHHDDHHGDMFDKDSLEAKHLQEEEDRLIATHEQLNEDLLAKQHRRTGAKKNSTDQENRLSESKKEKMDTDDATTEQDQSKNVPKTETNSQGKDAPNTGGGHHDDHHGDMYDKDSLEAKHLQEEEDRLIATHEQLNEDLLAKQHRRTRAKKNSNEQENRLSKSKEEKMDTDDATTEQDQTKNVTKKETNSQGKDAPNTERNSQEMNAVIKDSDSQEKDVITKDSKTQVKESSESATQKSVNGDSVNNKK